MGRDIERGRDVEGYRCIEIGIYSMDIDSYREIGMIGSDRDIEIGIYG